MSHLDSSPRARRLATASAVALVTGLCAVATDGPAALAAPTEDCVTAYPVADLQDGDLVEGYTVSKGTTPDLFTGEVLGVLEDGIAPGLDMVIMDLESEAIDAAGGIWQGMSGSPVYTEDGDLIGAVAYGLSFGPSPVAGITPFEEMDDYLTDPAVLREVRVDPPTARRIAASGGASRSQAEQGFEMLGVDVGVTGVRASRLTTHTHDRRSYVPQHTYAAGRAGAGTTSADDVVAGGNLAASYAHGDINFAGVGTATSVCDGRVVGFGHPFDFVGETTMSLHPATAIYVQPESLGAPFKVANIGDPVGAITQDRLTGITGAFGTPPPGADITSSMAFGSRQRTGSTTVTVPGASAAATFFQLIANHDRVIDAIAKGTELQAWTITGSHRGRPFTFTHEDRFTSTFDIATEASFELADLVFLLSGVEDVVIDDITVDSEVTKAVGRYRLKGAQVRVRGDWVRVSGRNPIKARAGRLLTLRAVLKSSDGSRVNAPFTFRVPKSARRQTGQLFLTGGNEFYGGDFFYEELPDSFPEVAAIFDGLVRNDTVLADLLFSPGVPFGEDGDTVVVGCEGCRGDDVGLNQSATVAPVDQVVGGFKRIPVRVK